MSRLDRERERERNHRGRIAIDDRLKNFPSIQRDDKIIIGREKGKKKTKTQARILVLRFPAAARPDKTMFATALSDRRGD